MSASSAQDLKDFQNPSGYWDYAGKYSIELATTDGLSNIPPGVEVRGNIVTVFEGHMKQTQGGGIQFYSRGVAFYWTRSRMKTVRNGFGELLWVNQNYV